MASCHKININAEQKCWGALRVSNIAKNKEKSGNDDKWWYFEDRKRVNIIKNRAEDHFVFNNKVLSSISSLFLPFFNFLRKWSTFFIVLFFQSIDIILLYLYKLFIFQWSLTLSYFAMMCFKSQRIFFEQKIGFGEMYSNIFLYIKTSLAELIIE